MPKSHRKKTRRGGSWYDPRTWTSDTSTSGSSWTSSLTSWTPSWLSKKEQPQPSYGAQPQQQPSYGAQPQQSSYGMGYGMGGKKKQTKRGGSYSPNMSLTNLAANASPVSGIQTVKAQTWVGGKTKKRRHRHRHNKSCKHR